MFIDFIDRSCQSYPLIFSPFHWFHLHIYRGQAQVLSTQLMTDNGPRHCWPIRGCPLLSSADRWQMPVIKSVFWYFYGWVEPSQSHMHLSSASLGFVLQTCNWSVANIQGIWLVGCWHYAYWLTHDTASQLSSLSLPGPGDLNSAMINRGLFVT